MSKKKPKCSKTDRGFGLIAFTDIYENKCSLQDSSLATEPAIWLGVDDAAPQIRNTEGPGWVEYPIPKEVLLSTRMHLTQDMVKDLLPYLQYFAETGNYLKDYEPFQIKALLKK